jgi:protein arginine kinase activator
MLMCQLCRQRQATVHFTRIINGQKVEMYVCEACARESNEIKLNLHQLLSGIMGQEASKGIPDEPVPAVKCAVCGMTAEEFNKTGLLGCTECYRTFGESIHTLLKRIHGNVKHHGKVPMKLSSRLQPVRNLLALKQELQKCILEENYEQAAVLRDLIKEAEKAQG